MLRRLTPVWFATLVGVMVLMACSPDMTPKIVCQRFRALLDKAEVTPGSALEERASRQKGCVPRYQSYERQAGELEWARFGECVRSTRDANEALACEEALVAVIERFQRFEASVELAFPESSMVELALSEQSWASLSKALSLVD